MAEQKPKKKRAPINIDPLISFLGFLGNFECMEAPRNLHYSFQVDNWKQLRFTRKDVNDWYKNEVARTPDDDSHVMYVQIDRFLHPLG